MASRAKINTSSLIRSSAVYSPQASSERSLAVEYGATIENVVGMHDFHTILRTQAAFLLQNSGVAIHPQTRPFQQLQKPHKREQGIITPAEQQHDRSATLRILFPYVPQYGYLQELEAQQGLPLRMTFGIEQPLGTDEPNEYNVGYTNLWVAKDYTAPVDGALRVLKDTVAHPVVLDAQGVEDYFDRAMRSRYAATFAVEQALEHFG